MLTKRKLSNMFINLRKNNSQIQIADDYESRNSSKDITLFIAAKYTKKQDGDMFVLPCLMGYNSGHQITYFAWL